MPKKENMHSMSVRLDLNFFILSMYISIICFSSKRREFAPNMELQNKTCVKMNIINFLDRNLKFIL